MASLLTGSLGRTAGWLHTDARQRPARPLDLRVRQWFCLLSRRHDFIRGVSHRRLYLICRHCFYETPGWDLRESPRDCRH